MTICPKAALAGLATALCVHSATAGDGKVGLLLPCSGACAALGTGIDAGVALGIATFGAGRGCGLLRGDTEVAPPVGLAETRKLVLQDRVEGIDGEVSSGVPGAKVPPIVANAGNDDATGETCGPHVIRLSVSSRQVNRPMGLWLAGQGVRKVVTMAPTMPPATG